MTYEWTPKSLRAKCKARRDEPFKNKKGEEEFHLKSLMSATINARGHGKSLEEAKFDFEANIANLYPVELI